MFQFLIIALVCPSWDVINMSLLAIISWGGHRQHSHSWAPWGDLIHTTQNRTHDHKLAFPVFSCAISPRYRLESKNNKLTTLLKTKQKTFSVLIRN